MEHKLTCAPKLRAIVAALSGVALFGGLIPVNQSAADTWQLARDGFSQLPLLPAPSARNGACIAYDPGHQNIVLFGGSTAERQVSLMSGTNVWLKLRRSSRYLPEPYLLDPQGEVWQLPYALCLNHTVEEIYENCLEAPAREALPFAYKFGMAAAQDIQG